MKNAEYLAVQLWSAMPMQFNNSGNIYGQSGRKIPFFYAKLILESVLKPLKLFWKKGEKSFYGPFSFFLTGAGHEGS